MKIIRHLFAAFVTTFAVWNARAGDDSIFTATVWRGETAHVEIPDNAAGEMKRTDGKTIDGVTVTCFSSRNVSYLTEVRGSRLAQRSDMLCPSRQAIGMSGPEYFLNPKFVKIAVDPTAKPGVRDFGPVTVRVVDRVLPPPAEWKYFLDLWQHPWAVARYCEAEPFSKKHYAAMEPVWKTLAECGVKALTVTLLERPWNHQCYDAYHSMIGRVKGEDGTWTFDYKIFDEYVAFGRKCGIGPDIACYTMCPWGYVVRWKDAKGEVKSAKALPGTPEFEDYWGDFLVDFTAHLKAKGWFADTYIAMDERSPEDVRMIAEFIQKKSPGMKIALAGNRKPSDFKGIVLDNYSQKLSDVTPEFVDEIKTRRAEGKKTTFYVCCAPFHPNTFMDSPDGEAFWLGVHPAFSGYDGFLRWAANSWPSAPYDDASFGYWKPGDTFLVYPNGEYSERLLDLRRGIVAAEKVRILREQGKFADELTKLGETIPYKQALQGKGDFRGFRSRIEELVNRP